MLGSIIIASTFPLINFEKLFTHTEKNEGNYAILNYTPNWNQIRTVITGNESNFTVWSFLYIAYWIGVIAMIVLFMIQIFSLINIHASATKNKYSIFTTYKDIQPLSFFKNIYINPIKHTSEELQTILQHEKVHTSQWHSLDLLLAEINKIVYWFNPGVWLLKNAIRENLEFIADKKVLESGKDAKQYQYELLHVITGTHRATAIAAQFSLLHLKNRITMMNKQKSGRWNKAKYLLLIPILCVVAVVVAQKNNKPILEQTKAVASKVSNTIQNDLEDFIKRHKKIKTASWGFINDIKIEGISDFEDKVTTGPLLHIIFKNEKFEMYQYNLKNDRIKFKSNYGEDMPTPSQAVINDYKNPDVFSPIENDFSIEVKTINGQTYAIAYDKNWKEVSRIKLGDGNSKEIKKWEAKYGKIPPPPPPAPNGTNGLSVPPPPPPIKEEEVVITAEKITGSINNATIEFKQNDASVKLTNKKGLSLFNKDGTSPLYVIDGTITSIEGLNSFDPSKIETIDILKGNAATSLYGEQGKNGVVLVKTKNLNRIQSGNPLISIKGKIKEEPLYVINNVIASKGQFDNLNPNQIQNIDVLKGNTAAALYGDNGKNGVISIKTKDNQAENNIPIVKLTKDRTNSTLWIGEDNSIEVISNSTTCDPKVSVENGTITGSNGSYIVNVSNIGIATVIVDMNGKKYEYVYTTKRKPNL